MSHVIRGRSTANVCETKKRGWTSVGFDLDFPGADQTNKQTLKSHCLGFGMSMCSDVEGIVCKQRASC